MTGDEAVAAGRTARTLGELAGGITPRDTIATGFPSVDNALGGGVRRGDLVLLGGEVGSGKSALGLGMAIRASESGARVRLLSGEMAAARIVERALAIEARVRLDDLRRGTLDDDARGKLAAAGRRVEDRLPEIGVAEASQLASLEAGETLTGIDLLIIDPMQSLAGGTRPLDEDLAVAARTLKRAAIVHDVCVIATSHLPAAARDRKDPRPQLDDFGAHGAAKQFADVILGLYRHEMYESAADVDGATELIVLKNRNGPLGYVDLFFYKQWMRFEDMLEPDR